MASTLPPSDLRGLLAMMPAFATPDAADEFATDTVNVEELSRAVDQIIRDGIDVIATTGSFGEFHTLLPDEHETLVRATVEAAGGRVPVFAGCLGLNTREVIARGEAAVRAGADGLLVGMPFYFPATQENALRFYRCIASHFADRAIMIYHNPTLHHVILPADLIGGLVREFRNVVAMKDSHRETRTFTELMEATSGGLSVFVAAWQYEPYADLGAAGFWSYDCWMDPRPHLELRDAVLGGRRGDARRLISVLHPTPVEPSLSWRETAAKIAIEKAGYCSPGPLRPPFVVVPAETEQRAAARAKKWAEVAGLLSSGQWAAGE